MQNLRLEIAESLFEFHAEISYQLALPDTCYQLTPDERNRMVGLLYAIQAMNARLDPSVPTLSL